MPFWKKTIASLLPPSLSLLSLTIYLTILGYGVTGTLALRGVLAFIIGAVVSTVGISRIIIGVEHSGIPAVRDSPMTLFRAFLQHWLSSDPGPLESRLDVLGVPGTIAGSILAFSNLGTPIGSFVVSNFHPGPYRDLGSGGLPSRLKATVERSIGGIVQVPHGISNHQLNIVSHQDVDRVINKIVGDYSSQPQIQSCTTMIRVTVKDAKASGQRFGDTAFLTLTLSPVDMEDLPSSVAFEIDREARARHLTVLVADAHNSLSNQTSITPDQAQTFVEASVRVLDQWGTAKKSSFKVGSASDSLGEFKLEDGIWPGGLPCLVV